MLAILVIHFLISMADKKQNLSIMGIAYIAITLLSLVSGYVSYRWSRCNKEVDLRTIIGLVQ